MLVQAIEAARILVAELELEGKITPEQFLLEREVRLRKRSASQMDVPARRHAWLASQALVRLTTQPRGLGVLPCRRR